MEKAPCNVTLFIKKNAILGTRLKFKHSFAVQRQPKKIHHCSMTFTLHGTSEVYLFFSKRQGHLGPAIQRIPVIRGANYVLSG